MPRPAVQALAASYPELVLAVFVRLQSIATSPLGEDAAIDASRHQASAILARFNRCWTRASTRAAQELAVKGRCVEKKDGATTYLEAGGWAAFVRNGSTQRASGTL